MATEETRASEAEASMDWCAPGYEPILGDGCFAAARKPTTRRLVLYLHGRYANDARGEEIDRQRRLASHATARGFSVLALRGHLGMCTDPAFVDWFCWPSNERNADAGPAIVGEWSQALATAQQQAGVRVRFLLGFSNGGYFAGLIAARHLLDVDGIVIAHAGPPAGTLSPTTKLPPLLLLSADDDIAQDDMIRFEEQLTLGGWAHDSYARAGTHGLTDEDIDAALTFFLRAREPLPLDPPLALHRAARHTRDAGDDIEPLEAQPPPDGSTPRELSPVEPSSFLGEASVDF